MPKRERCGAEPEGEEGEGEGKVRTFVVCDRGIASPERPGPANTLAASPGFLHSLAPRPGDEVSCSGSPAASEDAENASSLESSEIRRSIRTRRLAPGATRRPAGSTVVISPLPSPQHILGTGQAYPFFGVISTVSARLQHNAPHVYSYSDPNSPGGPALVPDGWPISMRSSLHSAPCRRGPLPRC
ncbi:hypothetical protein FH972_026036 [Carpinus fangiana]|uniref:Uncharacterized protein n=1 Tax=Carpinus fangiana TaxID=176857 RepID=A0A5N6L3A7_9ROSI|nr:hypothetical protein FH972_026036 [Carpinus fangiana]